MVVEEEKEEVAAAVAVAAGVTRSRMNESRYTGDNLEDTKKSPALDFGKV